MKRSRSRTRWPVCAKNSLFFKTFPLRENEPDSFGAICGGEGPILIEPQLMREALFVVGAGHCAQAIVLLAVDYGLFVQVIADRAEPSSLMPFRPRRREVQRERGRVHRQPPMASG
ncbi:MAG: hypothetical protein ABIU29_09580 [Chthoniobacterales bacterium]